MSPNATSLVPAGPSQSATKPVDGLIIAGLVAILSAWFILWFIRYLAPVVHSSTTALTAALKTLPMVAAVTTEILIASSFLFITSLEVSYNFSRFSDFGTIGQVCPSRILMSFTTIGLWHVAVCVVNIVEEVAFGTAPRTIEQYAIPRALEYYGRVEPQLLVPPVLPFDIADTFAERSPETDDGRLTPQPRPPSVQWQSRRVRG